MLPTSLNTYALDKLKFKVPLLVILFLFCSISTYKYFESINTKMAKSNESGSLTSQLEDINTKLVTSQEALKLWRNGLDAKYLIRNGLKVELTKKRIEIIKGTYNIQNLNIILENPFTFNSVAGLKYENIVFSKLNIEYSSYTDIESIKFLNALISQIPGTVFFNEVEISAPQSVITDINFALGHGGIEGYKNFVKTKVSLLWFDIEDKVSENKPPIKS